MTIAKRLQALKDKYGDPATIEEFSDLVPVMVNDILKTRVLIGFGWNLSYSPSVSNTHECPVGGVTNWGGRTENAPTGYPGWHGRIWVLYDKEFGSNRSEHSNSTLKQIRIHTGTGGYGAYNQTGGPWDYNLIMPHKWAPYSWDVRFFSDDWPLEKTMDEHKKARMLSVLRGESPLHPPRIIHYWYSKEVKEAIDERRTKTDAIGIDNLLTQ